MSRNQSSSTRRLVRVGDRIFDAIGARPLGLVVFVGSAALFLYFASLSASSTRADGIAVAEVTHHPAMLSSFTTAIFVRPGDRVEVGAPLVELSARFLDQAAERIDLEIARVRSEETPSADLDARLEALLVRRSRIMEQRESLVVTASAAGIVSDVVSLGASVAEGTSVAEIMPAFAEEIVAYVPASTEPARIARGTSAYLVGSDSEGCRGVGRVRNRGARVEEAPSQLAHFLGLAVHGMPVHVSPPPGCRLINGQAVVLRFRSESS